MHRWEDPHIQTVSIWPAVCSWEYSIWSEPSTNSHEPRHFVRIHDCWWKRWLTNQWPYSNKHYLPAACSIPSGGFCILPTSSHTGVLFSQKKSNICAPWALPYLSHCSERVKGLRGVHLKCPSFLAYHCPLTSSVQMVLIELNNLSGWVNRAVCLSLAVRKLNRHLQVHKRNQAHTHTHTHTQK